MPSDTIESVDGPLIKGRVFHQYQSFLSLKATGPETLKNLLSQTLVKTRFDFVTFLAAARESDIRAQCSMWNYGLIPDLLRFAASSAFR